MDISLVHTFLIIEKLTFLSCRKNKLPELLEEVDLATRQKMWWQ